MQGATDEQRMPAGGPVRPSALDQAFLELEQPGSPPLHIGFAVEIAGPAPSVAVMRALIAAAIGVAPELTRRLVRDPLTGSLRWFDDPWFDAAAHIDAFHVDALGDRASVDALLSRLFAPLLPRDRPLWRFQALGDGDATLMAGQLHHVIADGVGTVELALRLLGGVIGDDRGRHAELPRAGALEGVLHELRGMLRGGADPGLVRDLAGALPPALQGMAAHGGERWDGPREIARARVPLDALRGAVRGAGGTVTAALIVAVARALAPTGVIDPSGGSHAFVPLNARGAAAEGRGNPLSVVYTALPGRGDRIAALREVTGQLRGAREGAGALGQLLHRADDLPSVLRGGATRTLYRHIATPVIVSSIPGPPEPLELLGRPITGMWGWAPSPAGQPVALSAVSYAGELFLTLVADRDAVVDGAATLEAIARELTVLAAAAAEHGAAG